MRLANATGVLVSLVSVVALAACGGQSRAGRQEAEVRALFASIASDGRGHNFTRICRDEMAGVLRELDYLVGGHCAKDLAAEWAEGVQLTRVGPDTRVSVKGNAATIYDGPTPDRAISVRDQWVLAEFPRNKRLAKSGEAREVLDQVNSGAASRLGKDWRRQDVLGAFFSPLERFVL
jgi:hypothetical protein